MKENIIKRTPIKTKTNFPTNFEESNNNHMVEFSSIKDYTNMINKITSVKKEKLLPQLIQNQNRLLLRKKVFIKLLGDNIFENKLSSELVVTVNKQIQQYFNILYFKLYDYDDSKNVFLKKDSKLLTKDNLTNILEIKNPNNLKNNYSVLSITDLNKHYEEFSKLINSFIVEFIEIQKNSVATSNEFTTSLINCEMQKNILKHKTNLKSLNGMKKILENKKIENIVHNNLDNWVEEIKGLIDTKQKKLEGRVHILNNNEIENLKNNLSFLFESLSTFTTIEIDLQEQIIDNFLNGAIVKKGFMNELDELDNYDGMDIEEEVIELLSTTMPHTLKEKNLTSITDIINEIISNNRYEHIPYLEGIVKDIKKIMKDKYDTKKLLTYIENIEIYDSKSLNTFKVKLRSWIFENLNSDYYRVWNDRVGIMINEINNMIKAENLKVSNEFFDNQNKKYNEVFKYFRIKKYKEDISNKEEFKNYKSLLKEKENFLNLVNDNIQKLCKDNSELLELCNKKIYSLVQLEEENKIKDFILQEEQNLIFEKTKKEFFENQETDYSEVFENFKIKKYEYQISNKEKFENYKSLLKEKEDFLNLVNDNIQKLCKDNSELLELCNKKFYKIIQLEEENKIKDFVLQEKENLIFEKTKKEFFENQEKKYSEIFKYFRIKKSKEDISNQEDYDNYKSLLKDKRNFLNTINELINNICNNNHELIKICKIHLYDINDETTLSEIKKIILEEKNKFETSKFKKEFIEKIKNSKLLFDKKREYIKLMNEQNTIEELQLLELEFLNYIQMQKEIKEKEEFEKQKMEQERIQQLNNKILIELNSYYKKCIEEDVNYFEDQKLLQKDRKKYKDFEEFLFTTFSGYEIEHINNSFFKSLINRLSKKNIKHFSKFLQNIEHSNIERRLLWLLKNNYISYFKK